MPNIRRCAQRSATDTDTDLITQCLRGSHARVIARWGSPVWACNPSHFPTLQVFDYGLFSKVDAKMSHGQPPPAHGSQRNHRVVVCISGGMFDDACAPNHGGTLTNGCFLAQEKKARSHTPTAKAPHYPGSTPYMHIGSPHIAGRCPAALLRLHALGTATPPLKPPVLVRVSTTNRPARTKTAEGPWQP